MLARAPGPVLAGWRTPISRQPSSSASLFSGAIACDLGVRVRVAVADVIRDRVDHEQADAAEISRATQASTSSGSRTFCWMRSNVDDGAGGDEPRLEVDLAQSSLERTRRSLRAW